MNIQVKIFTRVILICILIPSLTMGNEVFDPLKPWPKPNDQLPKGCYKYDLDHLICFRVGDHQTATYLEGAKQCEANKGGRLAVTMTRDIWNNIYNDLIKPNNTRRNIINYVYLGAKVPANSMQLIGFDGGKIDLTATSVWATLKPSEQTTYERCAYGTMDDGNIYTTALCSHNMFSLCEYKMSYSTGCSAGTLHDQLPNASLRHPESNECAKFREKIDHNETFRIKCNEGFVLIGPSTVTCNATTWMELPRCVPGCHPPEPRKNSKLWSSSSTNARFEYGQRALFFCDEGHFTANGNKRDILTATCARNGEWTFESDDYCVTGEQFRVTNVEVRERYQPLFLLCPIWNPEWKIEDVIWFKNDEKLTADENYTIKENGSLFISKVGSTDVGFYVCFHADVRGEKLSPRTSNQMYKVAFRSPCNRKSISLTEKVYSEGEVIVLTCPTNSPEQHVFNWYKNGRPLTSNAIHAVSPSGGLYLGKSHFTDTGNYTCHAIDRLTDCEFNVTRRIIVAPKIKNLCNSKELFLQNYYNKNSLQIQPWLARIWFNKNKMPWCYGTIVDNRWIITIADCLEKFELVESIDNFLSVEMGMGIAGPDRFAVESIKIHPEYERGRPENNVALVKMKSQLQFSNHVLPACIVNTSAAVIEKRDPCRREEDGVGVGEDIFATVGGWGSLDVDDVEELKFRTEILKIGVSKKCLETCIEKFSEGMFCANGTGSDTFAGDSGSPLVVQSKEGKINLIGIYSWGLRGIKKGNFDYFVNVTFHHEWIERVISAD